MPVPASYSVRRLSALKLLTEPYFKISEIPLGQALSSAPAWKKNAPKIPTSNDFQRQLTNVEKFMRMPDCSQSKYMFHFVLLLPTHAGWLSKGPKSICQCLYCHTKSWEMEETPTWVIFSLPVVCSIDTKRKCNLMQNIIFCIIDQSVTLNNI